MTYLLKRYQSLKELLDDEELQPNGNYRLLSTGEAIELPSEDKFELTITYALIEAILLSEGISTIRRLRRGDEDIEVQPMGDRWVNRQPDLVLLNPERLRRTEKAIYLFMNPPDLVAERVSIKQPFMQKGKRSPPPPSQLYSFR